MKNKFTVAIPPERCYPRLTAGKEYKILKWHNKKDGEIQDHFVIINDIGDTLGYCLPNKCCFAGGGNWKLK